jgi:hypothetical protein
MTSTRTIVLVLSCLFINLSIAGESQPDSEKLHLSSSETMKVSMQVESVDHVTREIVLRDSSGELIPYVADEEMINLAQLNAGDIVIAEYTENYYIDVFDADGAIPSESEFTAAGTAAQGHKPGISAFDSQIVTALVKGIDLEAGTYTLKWADGSEETLTAQNPENLTKGEVGDLLVVTRTVNLDISVEETD